MIKPLKPRYNLLNFNFLFTYCRVQLEAAKHSSAVKLSLNVGEKAEVAASGSATQFAAALHSTATEPKPYADL